MARDPSFTIDVPAEGDTGTTLVVGQVHVGMSALNAADYLVKHLESTQIGHVSPRDFPAIAPFEKGVPRHHTRLYNVPAQGLTVLVGELFVPVGSAGEFADALLDWVERSDIDEIAVLHGVPFPHGPEEHEVFHVSTPDYAERRLGDGGIQPLKGGFLDGVVGELVTRSLDETAPATGVLVTPTHPPGPDVDAAIRLINTLERLYGFDVDEGELRRLGEELKRYYEELADRMQTLTESEQAMGSHDYPEDRMYM